MIGDRGYVTCLIPTAKDFRKHLTLLTSVMGDGLFFKEEEFLTLGRRFLHCRQKQGQVSKTEDGHLREQFILVPWTPSMHPQRQRLKSRLI